MADAAAKEPSMDDILSSIRKIIAEEGHNTDAAEHLADEPSSVRESEESHRNFSEEVFKQDPSPTNQSHEIEMPSAPQAEINASAPDMKTMAAQMDNSVKEMQSQATQMERIEMAQATKAPTTPFVAPTPSPDLYQGENRRTDPPMAEQAINAVPVEQAPASVEEVSSFKGALMSPGADSAVANAFERLKRSTQEDLDAKTEEILRPMLREWLDENLPTMVERLIREEIERVARGV